jgi:outer membrane lipoprotein SlyB
MMHMIRLHSSLLTGGLLLLACSFGAQAQTSASTSKPQTPQQAATARYEADKKLCAEEASSEARVQCRRDAKAIYDKAIAALAPAKAPAQPVACTTCGKVTAVKVTEKPGESNALGMIAGGVAGAVLGNQVGGGTGKTLATVAGAAGGAYAGKKVQENMNASKVWTVSVRYNDGKTAEFNYEQDPGFKSGDAVRKSGDVLVRN